MKFTFTPITGGYDESWLIKRLDKSRSDSKFALIGSMWWVNALAILISKSSIDKDKFYEKVNLKNFEDSDLNNVFCSMLMAYDYFNSVKRLSKLENTDNLMRIAIISWYYGIYNAAQAMILSMDNSSPQTHVRTADEWYEKLVSRNLIPFPFDYCLHSLVESKYLAQIEGYEDHDKNDNKKPRDIATAKAMCCSYLKSTAKWYFETKYRNLIKLSKDFKELKKSDFKSKDAKLIRDRFLDKKKISFYIKHIDIEVNLIIGTLHILLSRIYYLLIAENL